MLQPDIPHIDEHVSKVECIGVKTQQKLLDIKGAAAAVGIQDLNVIHNSITTGGQSTPQCHAQLHHHRWAEHTSAEHLNIIHNSITTGGQSTTAQNGEMLQGNIPGLVRQPQSFIWRTAGCFFNWVKESEVVLQSGTHCVGTAHSLLSPKRKQSI